MGEERGKSEFDCYIIVPYNSFMNLSKTKKRSIRYTV
jgi:hypothetical protein